MMESKAGRSYREYNVIFSADNDHPFYYTFHTEIHRVGVWPLPKRLVADLIVPVKQDEKTFQRTFQTEHVVGWNDTDKAALIQRLPLFGKHPDWISRLQFWMLYHGLRDDDALSLKKRWELGRVTVNVQHMLDFLAADDYEPLWMPQDAKYERHSITTTLVPLPKKKKGTQAPKFDVYIGWGKQIHGWNLPKSAWKFLYLNDLPQQHQARLQEFGTSIYNSPEKRKELEKLRGLRLGCDCTPDVKKPCHGTVLQSLLDGTFKPLPSKPHPKDEDKKSEASKSAKSDSKKRRLSSTTSTECHPKKLKITLKTTKRTA